MVKDILAEARRGLPTRDCLGYTRRAFRLLPQLERPQMLDIGCGSGRPTIELVKMSNGKVIGIDIDHDALRKLEEKALELGLSDRIRAMRCSMFEMDFPSDSFALVWAEGYIWVMGGIEEGLRRWRGLIKPGGFLVVHDGCWLEPDPPQEILDHCRKNYPGISTHEENLDQIPRLGYSLIGQFTLPRDAWGSIYFNPLKERISMLRGKHQNDPDALAALDREEELADFYLKYSRWYGSAFYIMRKE